MAAGRTLQFAVGNGIEDPANPFFTGDSANRSNALEIEPAVARRFDARDDAADQPPSMAKIQVKWGLSSYSGVKGTVHEYNWVWDGGGWSLVSSNDIPQGLVGGGGWTTSSGYGGSNNSIGDAMGNAGQSGSWVDASGDPFYVDGGYTQFDLPPEGTYGPPDSTPDEIGATGYTSYIDKSQEDWSGGNREYRTVRSAEGRQDNDLATIFVKSAGASGESETACTLTIPAGSSVSEDTIAISASPSVVNTSQSQNAQPIPLEFEVVPGSWKAEVAAPNPLAKLSGLSGLGSIPEIEVLPAPAKTMIMQCKVRPKPNGNGASKAVIRAEVQKWQLKISQDVIASNGGEFTASNGKWTYSLATVPCRDGDITDAPIPQPFQDLGDIKEIKASDRPAWPMGLWLDSAGTWSISGGTNIGKLQSGKRDETFIARVYVENTATHEKQYLKWLKWRSSWNVSLTATANQNGSTTASYTVNGTPTIKKLDEGEGPGPLPATADINPNLLWKPSL